MPPRSSLMSPFMSIPTRFVCEMVSDSILNFAVSPVVMFDVPTEPPLVVDAPGTDAPADTGSVPPPDMVRMGVDDWVLVGVAGALDAGATARTGTPVRPSRTTVRVDWPSAARRITRPAADPPVATNRFPAASVATRPGDSKATSAVGTAWGWGPAVTVVPPSRPVSARRRTVPAVWSATAIPGVPPRANHAASLASPKGAEPEPRTKGRGFERSAPSTLLDAPVGVSATSDDAPATSTVTPSAGTVAMPRPCMSNAWIIGPPELPESST